MTIIQIKILSTPKETEKAVELSFNSLGITSNYRFENWRRKCEGAILSFSLLSCSIWW